MAMNRSLAARLAEGDRLLGTVLTLPSPEAAELLAACGYDWLLIDLEHGAADILTAQRMLQAARCPCLVRVADGSPASLQRALDTGADGVIIPGLRTAAEVEQAVAACRYPPLGNRSVGTGRAQGYGHNLRGYVHEANLEVLVIPQIGHIDAVQDIEAISAVVGVSALFVGALDLAASLGRPGMADGNEVYSAIHRVKQVCDEADRRVGIYSPDADSAARWLEAGFTLVAVATDAVMMGQRARDLVQLLK